MTDDIQTRITHLSRRLEDGWQRIRDAEQAGQDIHRWEEFWLSLLADYERLCDEAEAQAEAAEQAALL